MKLSLHCQVRLNSFDNLVQDPSYGIARAIEGLKGWKYSQAYRLTDYDNSMIDLKIRCAESLNKSAKQAKKKK